MFLKNSRAGHLSDDILPLNKKKKNSSQLIFQVNNRLDRISKTVDFSTNHFFFFYLTNRVEELR